MEVGVDSIKIWQVPFDSMKILNAAETKDFVRINRTHPLKKPQIKWPWYGHPTITGIHVKQSADESRNKDTETTIP